MHKTGTTALQTFLAVNRVNLALSGVHYPRAGRHRLPDGLFTPGHHQIAFDFIGAGGSAALAQVFDEMRTVQASTVIVSSEELHRLLDLRGAFETIAAHAREIGYSTAALVTFRAQPDYLESVYAEIAKTELPLPFEQLVDAAVETGAFTLRDGRRFELAYEAIVEQLAAALGGGNVIARAYRDDRGSAFMVNDFLSVVATLRGRLALEHPANPLPRANERFTLRALLNAIARTDGDWEGTVRAAVPDLEADDLDAPVSLATSADRARFLARFGAGNAALNTRFGIEIPFVEPIHAVRAAGADTRTLRHRAALGAILRGRS